jgi:hypothetical protein
MSRGLIACIFGGSLAVSGCAIHPLPEDYTPKDTFEIVHAIRCEARQAILDHAPEKLFEPAIIGFEFTLTMSEKDKANLTNLEFKKVLSPGSLTVPFNASAEKDRSNERNFKILETFAQLKKAHCPAYVNERNIAYPITGSIGLAEVIRTYARLERMTNLAGGTGGKLPTFADKLTFTTTLDAGVKPALVLNTLPKNFRLDRANGDFSLERKDIHKVTLAIARDNRNDPPERARSRAARSYSYVNSVATNHIQDEAGARERVLLELDRQRLLDFYERGLLVVP